VDLSTTYLGLELPHPFMNGASPLTQDLDAVRRLEDAGAAAIVMHSLFEEQIEGVFGGPRPVGSPAGGEGGRLVSGPGEFPADPHEYLEQVRRIRAAVDVPVIASLNGTTPGGWLAWAALVEDAGAQAIELNVYEIETDPRETAADVERRVFEIVRAVVEEVEIPVAVKLSPFFTALAHFARRMDAAGARGLVLFNRFYQPDIDVEERSVTPRLRFSEPHELLLRLRWLAILSERVVASLAVSGGVHESLDAVKAILAGAHAVQMVSALMTNGPEHLRTVREGVGRWLVERRCDSLPELRGSMGLLRCPDPKAFERGNYLRVLQNWRGAL
jgi:dihydroorotate dehydrogenase (fumarate)